MPARPRAAPLLRSAALWARRLAVGGGLSPQPPSSSVAVRWPASRLSLGGAASRSRSRRCAPDAARCFISAATGTRDGLRATPPLRITTLGSLRLECGGADLGGEWLDHRPGRLRRYLISARGRRAPVEELVDMLWPSSRTQGLTSLRQGVHGLRDRLEPDRQKQTPSRCILARRNAYELNTESIVVDADEFDEEGRCCPPDRDALESDVADAHLANAAQLYRDEFLSEERYAEWTINERGRLADLAADVLRALAKSHLEAGEAPSATSALQRLADLEPLDLDAQRDLITLMIRQRRHGEAARRYEQVRRQFTRAFGHEPDFALSDLVERSADAA